MKIAITTDPMLPVPPRLYGGIERIIDLLVRGLLGRDHEVTLFAHADSEVPCQHVPYGGTDAQSVFDTLRNTLTVSQLVSEQPDVIHSFGRLAYLTPLLPLRTPKIMSYQRGPTPSRRPARRWRRRTPRPTRRTRGRGRARGGRERRSPASRC